MKTKTVMMAVLFLAGTLTAAFGEAIVTLKSGDVLRGDIVSDTNDVLQIRAFSANRSMSSLRNIPRADIQDVHIETPAEVGERVDYAALSRLQLNADQEQSTDFYTQWIVKFEKFLNDYPKSDKTTIIQQRLEACQAELKHVADGEVKLGNKWMTPAEKKPQALSRELASLEKQRAALALALAAARGRLAGLQSNYQTLPPAQKPAALTEVLTSQQRIATDGQTLANLDARIQNLKVEIPQAQYAYEVAAGKTNQEPVQVAAPPPRPSAAEPIAAPPVAAEPESWIAKNKTLLAIGGGVLLLLLILAYPFKLLLQKSGISEAKRDEQRRVARDKLKKVFDRIFAEGERPTGDNTPEGEVVPIGKGEDSYGGGRWFVICDAHIWAVQNNGRDTDNWVYNNVVTTGHGAVGARIPMDPELADYIKIEADLAK